MEGKMEKKGKDNQSLADAMIERIRKALNAEAKDKNAPRRYQLAEAIGEEDDEMAGKLEEE